MADSTPHDRHADDAHADDGAPTDAFTDEVREDAATAGDGAADNESDSDE
jgi:hypothetical protein